MSGGELTADAVATYDNKLVLVERNKSPEGLALPGGHHEPGETLEATAIREMREETGLNFVPNHKLGVYDEPGRDPRGQKVSVVYTGEAYGEPGSPEDATEVSMVPLSDLEDIRDDLVFDHADIITDYLEGNAAESQAVQEFDEPESLLFYSDRKGLREYDELQADVYSTVNVPEDIEEGKRMQASNADGALAATLPVGNHPALGDKFVVGARFDDTYKTTLYDGSTEKHHKMEFPVIEVESSEVDEAIDSFSKKNPEWIKVGAKVNLL